MVLGFFQKTLVACGGYLWKVPYKLSRERKRGVRERLRNVESVINILNATGIRTQSLDKANMVPRYSQLAPFERYSYFSRNIAGRRPVHFYRHFTKVEIPVGAPYGYK